MPRAGYIHTLVELQKPISVPIDTVNNTGARKTNWETIGTFYAAISPQRGNETQVMGVSQGVQTFQFTARYISDINRTYRIKYGDRTFSMNSIVNTDNRNRELVIIATEVSGG